MSVPGALVCAGLALAGAPISVRHAMYIKRGKYGQLEDKNWGNEGIFCALFLTAIVLYFSVARHSHPYFAASLFFFTLVYMMIAVITITSARRCDCVRTCRHDNRYKPHPKTAIWLLSIHAVRYFGYVALLALSMI